MAGHIFFKTAILCACILAVSCATNGVIDKIQSTIVREWYGGFVGRIQVTPMNLVTEWDIRIQFRRRVYELQTDGAIVVEKRRQGRVYLLENTACNGALNSGDLLSFWFLADTFDGIKGLEGDVTFNWVNNNYPA